MDRNIVGRILWLAAEDEAFRIRTLDNLGMALAQEGFILDDAEMRQMTAWWDEIGATGGRRAVERIQALARAYKP